MTQTYIVGRDCDAWCTRCKMDLAHTIVAMVSGLPVQVICNTCNGAHKFRAPKSAGGGAAGTARRKVGTGAKRTTKAEREAAQSALTLRQRWDRTMAKTAAHTARPYNVREGYDVDDVLRHPKFGLGFVTDVLTHNKVKVLFEDCERTLVVRHGQSRLA